jgi:hypothetical protein
MVGVMFLGTAIAAQAAPARSVREKVSRCETGLIREGGHPHESRR